LKVIGRKRCNRCATAGTTQQFLRRSWHFGCTADFWRHFVRAIARLGLFLAALVLLAAALFTPRVVTPSLPGPRSAAKPAAAITDGPHERRAQQSAADGTVDLYGNEVSDAIATYSLDPTGSLYELHSPQTELPRLASPKS
jgi:hypothetical protein